MLVLAHDADVPAVCRAAECYGAADFRNPSGGSWMVSVRANESELDGITRSTLLKYLEPDALLTEALDFAENAPEGANVKYVPRAHHFFQTHFAEVAAATPSWGLDRLDDRWDMDDSYDANPSGGEGVHVYVFGSGMDASNAEFGGRGEATLQVLGRGAEECASSRAPCGKGVRGQGTHLAAVVGGATFGVAKKAILHSVKVLDDTGSGDAFWAVQAMEWVRKRGQRPAVIFMPLAATGRARFLGEAVERTLGHGIAVVMAAGDEGANACRASPRDVRLPGAITVAAAGHLAGDVRAVFQHRGRQVSTNYGPCVDIYAPGLRVMTVRQQPGAPLAISGSAAAAAHVAGAAALLLGEKPLTPAELWVAMESASTRGAVRHAMEGFGTPNRLLFVPVTYVLTKDPARTRVPPGKRCRSDDVLRRFSAESEGLCTADCLRRDSCKYASFSRPVCELYSSCERWAGLGWTTFLKLPDYAA